MRIGSTIAALLMLQVAALPAFGRGIGVNFVGLKPETQTLAPSDVAGAAPAAQAHWNNLTLSNDDGNGHNNRGKLDSVVDETGAEIKGLSVSVNATATTTVWPQNADPWGFTGANLTMQTGEIHPRPTITVKGIPFAKYDVYLYAAGGGNGGQGSARISAVGAGSVDPANTYFYNFNWQNGNFVKSTATTLADAQKSAGSNYVVFTGNTAGAITVEWNGLLGGGWTGVAGMQIVEQGAATAEKVAPQAKSTILPCILSAPACRADYGVKIKYRWDAKPMDKNYTAFVHFIGPDGAQAFQNDHGFDTPTSVWSGRVEYEKTIVVPHDAPAGDYKIMIGLYDPAAAARGWDRQPLKVVEGVEARDDNSYQIGVLKVSPDAPLPKLAPATLNLDGYKLTFAEEFDDLSVSAKGPCGPGGSRWIAHTPTNSDFGDARFMDPGQESPFSTEKGILRITARKDPAFAASDAYKREWRGGLLASIDPQGKGFSQKFGYFEMKAKFPNSPGMWPAFWLLTVPGSNPPGTPGAEIDIVEHYGVMPNNLCMTLHLWGPGEKHWARGDGEIVAGMTEDFHKYGVMVDENYIVWYFDGTEIRREKTPDAAKLPLYVLVNLAMGGGWPIDKATSPSYMHVDYVHVYAKN